MILGVAIQIYSLNYRISHPQLKILIRLSVILLGSDDHTPLRRQIGSRGLVDVEQREGSGCSGNNGHCGCIYVDRSCADYVSHLDESLWII